MPANSLSARNSVASSRSRCWSSAERGAGTGSAPASAATESSGIARRASVRASRRRRHQPPIMRAERQARARPPRRSRSTSARGGRAASRSQSLSTSRTKPGARSSCAGRCVWPWISVGVLASCIQRTAVAVSMSTQSAAAMPRLRCSLCVAHGACRLRDARPSGCARKSRCQAGERTWARNAGTRGRPGTAHRRATAAGARRRRPARSGRAARACRSRCSSSRADEEVAVAAHEGHA